MNEQKKDDEMRALELGDWMALLIALAIFLPLIIGLWRWSLS